MCANFGLDVEVDIPEGHKQWSDKRHTLKTKEEWRDFTVARGECRHCNADWGIHSNHAVRVIARYFLSLSLPFADCPNVECVNHGKNVYEHWTNRRSPSRAYRREGPHRVRCRGCGKLIILGTPRGVHITARKQEGRKRPEPYPTWVTRGRWEDIISGLYSGRSITDTYEQFNLSPGNYYRTLRRIGRRLTDYHSFRNARLLRPDGPALAHDGPARVYTDVLQVSLQAHRKDRRHTLLDVIVSVMLAERKIYVLAAHPCFLPKPLCPNTPAQKRDEERPMFQRRWSSVLHADTPINPNLATEEHTKRAVDLERDGCFISPPYAQLAHFLVIQKMLGRYRDIHCYMDGARDLSKAALVAFRERIIAGGAVVAESDAGRADRPKRAEVVLYQHERSATVGRSSARRWGRPLDRAWADAEKRFAEQLSPPDELQLQGDEPDPKVLADKYRLAFHGGFSDDGNWAWLRYPRDTAAYRNCRTLWATRMPTKTFESHGESALSRAMLQPVDSIMNSMRARVRPIARPLLSASGRSYRSNYIQPDVMLNELSVYLLRQNYNIRRKSTRPIIPAAAMGLLDDDEPHVDLTDCAWNFHLGVEHAELISRWVRQ